MKNILRYLKLERHTYAPELNKVHLFGDIIPAEGVTTIRGAKAVARKHLSVKKIVKGIVMESATGVQFLPNRYFSKELSLTDVLWINNKYNPKCKAVKIVRVRLV